LRGELDRSDFWRATRDNVRKDREQADRVNMRREINSLCRVYNPPLVS
jgi:hypothetical protein